MKKIHRFLIQTIPNDKEFSVEDKNINHLIKNVLKIKKGEEVVVFPDGGKDILCEIKDITKKEISLSKIKELGLNDSEDESIACISILKKDNFELVVQKLTEIGIKNIVPIISERTIKQSLNIERLQKISDEALEQSGRSYRAKILEPLNLEKSLQKYSSYKKVFFDMDGKKLEKNDANKIAFYIGPEGGWSNDEIEIFKKFEAISYNLGQGTLRAETASIVGAWVLLNI